MKNKQGWKKLNQPNPKHLHSSLVRLRDKLIPLRDQLAAEVARIQPILEEEAKKQGESSGG